MIRKRIISGFLTMLLIASTSVVNVNANEYISIEDSTIIDESSNDNICIATDGDAEEYDEEVDEIYEETYAVPSCTTYSGNNINNHDYQGSNWSQSTKSYLIKTGSNEWMRFQENATSNGYLVEYYDTSFNHIRSIVVPKQLSIFGGFYAGSNYYYIATGEQNSAESNSKEVIRITKYDKNWNTLGSAKMYGSYIEKPFWTDVSFAEYGTNLILRTSRRAYKTDDGLNHQTNLTIVVNTNNMTIVNDSTKNMFKSNSPFGYTSHSWAQYVDVDSNGTFAAVDQGDAYPRGIQLSTSSTVLAGKSGNATYTQLMSYVGSVGENYTGATLGGFEIGNTNYIVTGNTVVQDSKYQSRTTKNIFVITVNKSTKAVKTKWLTNFAEGSPTTTTPFIVKISSGKYMLIWSVDSKVYYTTMDENGNTSSIYNFEGAISDCKPYVSNGVVTWYTWHNKELVFYEINTADISRQKITEVQTGHDYGVENSDDSTVNLKCNRCGEQTTLQIPRNISFIVKKPTDQFFNYTDKDKLGSRYNVGEVLDLMIYTSFDTKLYKDVEVKSSNENVIKVDIEKHAYDIDATGKIYFLSEGFSKIEVFSRETGKRLDYKYIFVGNYQVKNFTSINATVDKNTIEVGETIKVNVSVLPLDATYIGEYRYWENCTTGNEKLKIDSVNNTVTGLKPGKTTLYVAELINGKSTFISLTVVQAPIVMEDIKITSQTNSKISAKVNATQNETGTLEYSWYIVKDGVSTCIKSWTTVNTLDWNINKFGDVQLVAKTRLNKDDSTIHEKTVDVTLRPAIKGNCQIPYSYIVPGEQGYLIGLEVFANSKADKVEMLILDCTSMQWVYTTGKCGIVDNCLWTVWQPQYGYYWTLFRVYDKNGSLIDEVCYGFQNI